MTAIDDFPGLNEPTVEPDETAPAPSKLEQLRSRFAEQASKPRLFKRLPAGDGRVVAEYRLFTTEEAKTIVEAEGTVLARNQDALICALVALHTHDPEHPAADDRGLVALHVWIDDDAGTPYGFDHRLVDALDLIDVGEGTARQIVLRLFDGNEIALGAQAAELLGWMADTRSEALQDFKIGS